MSAPNQAPVKEEPFFFSVAGGDRVFGLLHRPARIAGQALVLCHAFAEEKLWSHRVYVTFARELARAGHPVLRFDMRGEGDSDLDFEETDVESRIADTLQAITTLQEKIGSPAPVALVGHRFGGSIAAAAAARAGEQVFGVAVWDPIMDGADYFSSMLRSNLATQMATAGKVTRTRDALIKAIEAGEMVVADGYGLGAQLYQQMAALQWSTRPELFSRPMLVLEVPKADQQEASSALSALAATHPQLQTGLAAEPPFWRETRQFHRRAANFTAATEQWLSGARS